MQIDSTTMNASAGSPNNSYDNNNNKMTKPLDDGHYHHGNVPAST